MDFSKLNGYVLIITGHFYVSNSEIFPFPSNFMFFTKSCFRKFIWSWRVQDSQEVAVSVCLWMSELHADLKRADLGNHSNAPQLLGNHALHDPLEGLLDLDDIVLVEH